MPKLIDLTGQRFGRLTVVSRAENTSSGHIRWHCLCDCGKEVIRARKVLRGNETNSCGCIKKEKLINRNKRHGSSKTRLYNTWINIKKRTSNKNHPYYSDYGGRGIFICDEWKNDFRVFEKWALLNGYAGNLTIDRIDNNKGYFPDNCRWADFNTQENNRRNNHRITYKGETKTLQEWAEITNIKRETLRSRIVDLNWDTEKALTTPTQIQNKK